MDRLHRYVIGLVLFYMIGTIVWGIARMLRELGISL